MNPQRHLLWVGVLAALLFGVTLTADAGQPISPGFVVSRFETGAEGWTLWSSWQPIHHDARGFISAPDSGTPWYWNAPDTFLGDQSAAFGGSLSFVVRDDRERGPTAEGPDVVLVGGGSELTHRGKPRRGGNDPWLTLTAHLHEAGGWRHAHNGQLATGEELWRTLAQLDRLLVRGVWHRGAGWGALKLATLLPGNDFHISAPGNAVKVKLSKNTLKFPTTYTGEEERLAFSITNTGTVPAVLAVPDDLGIGFSWFVKPAGSIPPGGTVQASIAFESSSLGRHDRKIQIGVMGRPKPLNLTLQAFNKNPIELSAKQLKFGKLDTGAAKSLSVRIKNASSLALGVYVSLIGAASAQFQMGHTPRLLAAGEEFNLTITYQPHTPGKHVVELRIVDEDVEYDWQAVAMLNGQAKGLRRAPKLVLSPEDTLSFGPEYLLGQEPPTNTFSITNTGNVNLELQALGSLNTPFQFVTGPDYANPSQAHVIPPNGSRTFGVRYAPTTAGEHADTIGVRSNDPEQGFVALTLLASARMPDPALFEIEPTEIDFGTYFLDEGELFPEGSLGIHNLGEVDLEIEIGAVAGPFRLEGLPTIRVKGGEFQAVRFFFEPTGPGTYETQVTFTTNDPTRPTVVITLRGGAEEGF
ncbi:MAG: choice-of-anchor D domain-containing protein [Actinomycetota bacterium]